MVFSGIFRVSSIELSNYFRIQLAETAYLFNAAQNTVEKECFCRKIKTHKITNFLAKIICFSYY